MIDKIFKIGFAFCLISCGVLALVYAFIILLSVLKPVPMPYCDEVVFSSPRPVGYHQYCKGREKTDAKIKPRGIIRNGVLLEYE